MPRLRTLALAVAALPVLAVAQAGGAGAARPGGERGAGEVRTLEERVSALREKLHRTRGRLADLQEIAAGAEATAARAVIVHRNEMGKAFRLESVSCALDGATIYSRAGGDADLAAPAERQLLDGQVPPGEHALSVELVYRGQGGPRSSYVDGYRFTVRSSQVFVAEPGKVSQIRIVGFEQGGPATRLEDRPAVRYELSFAREAPAPSAAPAPAPAAAPAAAPDAPPAPAPSDGPRR